MNIRTKTQRLTVLTMLLAMSITISMIESSISLGVPGVRLGLANALGLIALYFFGVKEMIVLNSMRVIISGIMRGIFLFNPGFWISVFGTLLSMVMAILAFKTHKFSEIGVSLVAATFHNIGQIIYIVMLTNAPMLFFTYLPFLLLMGIPTGMVTGSISQAVNKKFRR